MTPAEAHSRQQARLWSAAFGISALANVVVMLMIAVLSALGFSPGYFGGNHTPPPPPALEESVATIIPELTPTADAPAPTRPAADAPFVRTSRDQQTERPENASFIGERNTRAASDLPAIGGDPEMPGQLGQEPESEGHLETTVNDYQDGELASNNIAPPDPNPGPPAQEEAVASEGAQETPLAVPAASEMAVPERAVTASPAAPKESIAEGPFPVERRILQDSPAEPSPAPRDHPEAGEGTAGGKSQSDGKDPEPAVKSDTPGFNGYQRKTRIQGSITRQGRSALEVEDSPMGRYHAALSLAVEKEWNLNCIRNEKYLTEGKIIVEFAVEPSGKVRSLTFVEAFGVGNIQKGFTSESIRTAKIPPFPAELKKQLDGEPLEVTYSFTF